MIYCCTTPSKYNYCDSLLTKKKLIVTASYIGSFSSPVKIILIGRYLLSSYPVYYFELLRMTKRKRNIAHKLVKYFMCNTRVKQKYFFQIICDVHQILFLLPTVLANHVVLTSKMFSVNLKWLPSKLWLTQVELSRILHAHCYQYTNQPYLRTTGQPNSISMSDDNFKYLAMQLARKFEVSVLSFYTLN